MVADLSQFKASETAKAEHAEFTVGSVELSSEVGTFSDMKPVDHSE
jgi:hypothetical protein